MRFPNLTLTFWLISAAALLGGPPESAISVEDPLPFHLELGGEGRLQYERFHNLDWDPSNGTDDYWLQRYYLDADWRLAPNLRAFFQLGSSLVGGKELPLSPVERDELSIQQLYLEAKWKSIALRGGRQAMQLGSQRLVGLREGPNIRRSWDGLRILGETEEFEWTAFFLRPVADEPGVFDDPFLEAGTEFWGLYTTWKKWDDLLIDLYYLGLRREGASFATVSGLEKRHTLGLRLDGKRDAWDYEVELIGQAGEIDARDLLAGSLAGDLGYTFSKFRFLPRLGLQASISSGERGSGDTIETFSPLFPRGNYFGESAILGPVNHIELHPTLRLQLGEKLSWGLQHTFFWRQSPDDGLYSAPNVLARGPSGLEDTYVGSEFSTLVSWSPEDDWSLEAAYAHFLPGDFLEQSGPSAPVDYFLFSIQKTF